MKRSPDECPALTDPVDRLPRSVCAGCEKLVMFLEVDGQVGVPEARDSERDPRAPLGSAHG